MFNKIMKAFYFLILITLFCGCEELDLPRDNPADNKNNTNTIGGVSLKFSKYTIVSDDNGDAIINKNETVYLAVYIKNTGSADASGVKASISATSSYISQLSPTTQVEYNNASYSNDIPAGYEKFGNAGYALNYNNYTVKFKVSNTTPSGTVIHFNMNITDGAGNNWTEGFDITVEQTGAILNFSQFQVVDDDNDNNIINKNETVYLTVYIKNNGSSTANGVKASISTTNSYISQLYPSTEVDYNNDSYSNDISPGYEKFGNAGYAPNYYTYTVKFFVSNSTPSGSIIPFSININDAAGNNWSDNFNATIY